MGSIFLILAVEKLDIQSKIAVPFYTKVYSFNSFVLELDEIWWGGGSWAKSER